MSSDEASLTEDETESESGGAHYASDESDSGGGGGGFGQSRSVRSRLPKKSSFPVDHSRTAEWTADQIADLEARLEAARAAAPALQQPPSITGCTMHGYQLDGLRWLVALHSLGHSGILADEMGLGKTLQAIALISHLAAAAPAAGPALVLAPLSTLSSWSEQLATFCPSLRARLYTGDASRRAELRRRLAADVDVLLASYEPVLADAPELKGVAWRLVRPAPSPFPVGATTSVCWHRSLMLRVRACRWWWTRRTG